MLKHPSIIASSKRNMLLACMTKQNHQKIRKCTVVYFKIPYEMLSLVWAPIIPFIY